MIEKELFVTVHRYWEEKVFMCPLGTRDADGRELSAGEP